MVTVMSGEGWASLAGGEWREQKKKRTPAAEADHLANLCGTAEQTAEKVDFLVDPAVCRG
jgi:hypothetical protein